MNVVEKKMERTSGIVQRQENEGVKKDEKKRGRKGNAEKTRREGGRIFLFCPRPLIKLQVCFKTKLPLSILNDILFLCNFLLK